MQNCITWLRRRLHKFIKIRSFFAFSADFSVWWLLLVILPERFNSAHSLSKKKVFRWYHFSRQLHDPKKFNVQQSKLWCKRISNWPKQKGRKVINNKKRNERKKMILVLRLCLYQTDHRHRPIKCAFNGILSRRLGMCECIKPIRSRAVHKREVKLKQLMQKLIALRVCTLKKRSQVQECAGEPTRHFSHCFARCCCFF